MGADIEQNTWVRIVLVLTGVVALVLAFNKLGPVVTLLSNISRNKLPDEGLFQAFVIALLTPLPLLITAYLLVRYCDYFATRICGACTDAAPHWEQAAYRLGSTLAGLLVLSWALPRFAAVIINMCTATQEGVPPEWYNESIRGAWIALVYALLQSLFAVYLLLGAPHLVKWQMRRIHATKPTDNKERQS